MLSDLCLQTEGFLFKNLIITRHWSLTSLSSGKTIKMSLIMNGFSQSSQWIAVIWSVCLVGRGEPGSGSRHRPVLLHTESHWCGEEERPVYWPRYSVTQCPAAADPVPGPALIYARHLCVSAPVSGECSTLSHILSWPRFSLIMFDQQCLTQCGMAVENIFEQWLADNLYCYQPSEPGEWY